MAMLVYQRVIHTTCGPTCVFHLHVSCMCPFQKGDMIPTSSQSTGRVQKLANKKTSTTFSKGGYHLDIIC